MAKIYLPALLSALALLGACKNDAAKAHPGASRPVPPPPAIGGPPEAEVKALLTQDKLTRFATYRTAMMAATAAASDRASDQRAEHPKRDGAAGTDERSAQVAAANRTALAKSGLSQDEASKLSRIVTPYYSRMFALQDRMKRSADAHARVESATSQGKEPSPADVAMDRMHRELSLRLEAIRKDFGERYGEEALALVQKHEPDFLPLHEKMIGAALRGGTPVASPPMPLAPAKP